MVQMSKHLFGGGGSVAGGVALDVETLNVKTRKGSNVISLLRSSGKTRLIFN